MLSQIELCSFMFFCNVIKLNNFLHCFIILYHLCFSFLHIKSFIVPYVYVSTESIDCIRLSSFELKAVLLISSEEIFCLSLLNLCCVYNITFLFFKNSLWFFLRLAVLTFFMADFIFKLSCFKTVFIIFEFIFSFYDIMFCSCLFIFTYHYLLKSCKFLLLIQQTHS